MKKILAMFVCLLAFGAASAQNNKTTTTSGGTDNQDKVTMKNKSDNTMDQNSTMSSSNAKKKRSSKKATTTQTSRTDTNIKERANGTTGVQEYPDTQGAGTGTGNDSRKSAAPGQPENTGK